MPVTAIKGVENYTTVPIYVQNREWPDGPPISVIQPWLGTYDWVHHALCAPYNTKQGDNSWFNYRVDMWIPWCDSRTKFNGHHIDVFRWDGSRYVLELAIWQQDRRGDPNPGDKVRVSEGLYDGFAPATSGDSYVSGNRILKIFGFSGSKAVYLHDLERDN